MNMASAVSDGQISKVSSVLKSLARDWSVEGKAEREMTYNPIIAQIKKYLPLSEDAIVRPKICIPGAGENIGRT
jgi:carnosine N-methyltransferase